MVDYPNSFNIIRTLSDNDLIIEEISDKCNIIFKNLCLYGIYFVGSFCTKDFYKGKSDIDMLFVSNNNISIKEASIFRCYINEILEDQIEFYNIHYKIISITDYNQMSLYDGFRVLELQNSNLLVIGNELPLARPKLDINNFTNSITIQCTYSFLNNPSNCIKEIQKASYRVKRNLDLLNQNGINPYCEANELVIFCSQYNGLFMELSSILSLSDLNDYMAKYFKLFKHEYLNKYFIYSNNKKQLMEYEYDIKSIIRSIT